MLAPGRYLVTATLKSGTLAPIGTRVNAELIISAAGRVTYWIRKIEPNPLGLALANGTEQAPDGWQNGAFTISTNVLGQKCGVRVETNGEALTIVAKLSKTGIEIARAEGKMRYKGAMPEDTVPDIKPPAPTIRWQDRLGRQMLFMAAPNYQWAKMWPTEVNAALDAIAAAGLDGPSIEFGGTFIRDEYNKVPNKQDIADICDAQIAAWDVWDRGIRARGLVAHIAFLNANQSKGNKLSDAAWIGFASAFAQRYGADNKLVLPLSESDTRCRASIGNAIAKGLVAGGIPKSQIISMAGKWGDWSETHHGRGKVPSGNHRTIVVNDNGPSIRDLYGADWQRGGTPNLPRIEEYAAEIRRKGVSGAVYSFGTAFDFSGCAAAGKGWNGQVAPEQPGAGTLTGRYIGGSDEDIGWSPPVPRPESKYGRKQVKGKWCTGRLWGAPVGKPLRGIEWIKEGFQSAHVINAFARKEDGRYNQGLVGGEDMVFQIRSVTDRVVDPATFRVRMAR